MAARPLPDEDRIAYEEVDLVATPAALVTVRKTSRDGDPPFDVSALHPAAEHGCVGGPARSAAHRRGREFVPRFTRYVLRRHRGARGHSGHVAAGSCANATLRSQARAPSRQAHGRRDACGGATRARRTHRRRRSRPLPRGRRAALPDTYDTLVRATEELDIAREHVAGVRDHHQSKVVEGQGEVAKKLTVIASLVLVPTLDRRVLRPELRAGVRRRATGRSASPRALIVASTLIQLAIFRWRRWI